MKREKKDLRRAGGISAVAHEVDCLRFLRDFPAQGFE